MKLMFNYDDEEADGEDDVPIYPSMNPNREGGPLES